MILGDYSRRGGRGKVEKQVQLKSRYKVQGASYKVQVIPRKREKLPTKASIDKLDKLRFRDFLRDIYNQSLPDSPADQLRLLQNMNLATSDGNLNLAGVLMFAERPEWIKPQFVIKAIRYPGNQIHASEYVDTEDFAGPQVTI
jgi:predicted HTH transcriptional regulator